MHYLQRTFSICTALLLLAACGATAAAPTTVPSTAPAATAETLPTAAPAATAETLPTAAPAATAPSTAVAATASTVTSQATSAPTTASIAAPTSETSANVLPAPLYTNVGGQIVRLERDGTTQATLTNEPTSGDALAVTDFAVSPKNNALAYLVQKPSGGTALIGTDATGQHRTVLFDRADANASQPHWSPDGTNIIVGVSEFKSDGTTTGGGLYSIPAGGGEPKLLQANSVLTNTVPTTETTAIDANLVGYAPLSFSPDGTKILASRYSLQVEMCGLAIIPAAGGAPVLIEAPEPTLQTTCGPAAWSDDSSTLYTAFFPQGGGYSASAGLWRVDASTGKATVIVPPQANNKQVVIRDIAGPFNGAISGLISVAEKLPMNGDDTLLPYQMARIDIGTGAWTPLRTDIYTDSQILWAPDGSGAVLQEVNNNGLSTLTWTPASGGAPVPLAVPEELNGIAAWGRP